MNITIRRAKKTDLSQVLDLIHELADYEKAPDKVTLTVKQFEKDWESKHPLYHIFVAECLTPNPSPKEKRKKDIVGIALYYYGYSTWKGKRIYLDDIVVTEKMRGKGIGKLLFDKLILEAKKNKVKQIMWSVLDWNEPALNFYRKYKAELDAEWITGKLGEEQIKNPDFTQTKKLEVIK